jgi:hypothetical protein
MTGRGTKRKKRKAVELEEEAGGQYERNQTHAGTHKELRSAEPGL